MLKRLIVVFVLFNFCGFSFGKFSSASKFLRTFGFTGYEIYQFKYNTKILNSADINNDGIDDILFFNPRISRIEVLIRKKYLKKSLEQRTVDEVFDNRGFVVNYPVIDMKIVDINGDNLKDILTINTNGLQIYLQQKNGRFRIPPLTPYLGKIRSVVQFAVADINNDSKPDIIVSAPDKAVILWNNGDIYFPDKTILDYSLNSCRFCCADDFTGNGYTDLLFYFTGTDLPLRLREGMGNGKFSWEEAVEIPRFLYLDKIHPSKSKAGIGLILSNHLVFRIYSFSKSQKGKGFDNSEIVVPTRIPIKGESRTGHLSFLIDDFNNDGFSDVCIAAPSLNSIYFYMGTKDGLASNIQKLDSMSVSKMFFDDNKNIMIFSKEEGVVARHIREVFSVSRERNRRNHKILYSFPQLLEVPGKPVAFDFFDKETWFLTKEKSSYKLICATWDKNGKIKISKSFILSVSELPYGIKCIGENKNNCAVLIFLKYEMPYVYKIFNDKISKLNSLSLYPLSKGISPDKICTFKSNPSMGIILGKKLARIYKWNGNKFIILGQLNPMNQAAEIIGVKIISQNSDGIPGSLVLFDNSSNNILIFKRKKGGEIKTNINHGLNLRYTLFKTVHIKGDINEFRALGILGLGNNQGILIFCRNELLQILKYMKGLNLQIQNEYTTKAEKAFLYMFKDIKIAKERFYTAGLIDTGNKALQILEKIPLSGKNKLINALTFQVFQSAGYLTGTGSSNSEPHDLCSGDFNGDGYYDLAVLVHDKLIIYFAISKKNNLKTIK